MKGFKMFAALMVFSIAFLAAPTHNASAAAVVGKAAPAFTLTDLDGKTVKLADFKGKFVVLEWVNFECPFVRKHYGSENMQQLQKTYTGKDVVWISICSSAPGKQGHLTADEAKEATKERGASPSEFLLDSKGVAGRAYGAKTTPHMFVIDPKGKLIYAGAIDDTPSTKPADIPNSKNYVVAALDAALAGKPIETANTKPYGCSVKY